jgi:predicted amidophosphoribosyltransferase
LSPQQLAELRDSIQSVTCANCGAPVDLGNASCCGHCGTPISVLDFHQGERLIAELQRAAARRSGPASEPDDEPREDDPITGD